MRKEIKRTVVSCDICEKEDSNCKQVEYPVLFYTEQTEGRLCNPYISQQKIDLCDDCFNKVIKVKAHGAQGCNMYELIKNEV